MKPLLRDTDAEYKTLIVRRLVNLRFVAIAGQAIAVLVAMAVLQQALPWPPLFLILALLLAFNLVTAWRLHKGLDPSFSNQLWVDCFALAAVLGLTGGSSNPFSWFMLLPLVFAAMTLSRYAGWVFGAATVAAYTLVTWVHIPLPHLATPTVSGLQLQILGSWVGFVVCSAVIAYFVEDMARTLRRREQELSEARERALRNDNLLGLGIVAAGAAHELGTPLSTMAVLIQDLGEHEALRQDAEAREELGLLRGQIERCKRTLSVLSANAHGEDAGASSTLALGDYLERVVAQWRRSAPSHEVELDCPPLDRGLEVTASHGLTQTLANLLQNAAEASPEPITLRAFRRDDTLVLQVRDHGPGPQAIGDTDRPAKSTKGPGRGLGLYLSREFIRVLGGTLGFSEAVGGGTVAEITLPHAAGGDHAG